MTVVMMHAGILQDVPKFYHNTRAICKRVDESINV